ncbi:MAG TPA: type II toxin-antitoxin system RelE/ParE family toxin, partial [Thermohalobaculum sp.]|nr:type II toxin-antitoxin system RelE/ParE family toxin [Thermohalobaculum sp.]
MAYRIELSRPAARDVKAIKDKAAKQALRRAIEALAEDPFPRAAKKLRGEPVLWRLRVGGWRVVYTVEADRLLVLLIGGR